MKRMPCGKLTPENGQFFLFLNASALFCSLQMTRVQGCLVSPASHRLRSSPTRPRASASKVGIGRVTAMIFLSVFSDV